jgi:hypothetical protein
MSVVVVMDNGFLAVTELVFLLDYGRTVRRSLTLSDDGGVVAVAVTIAIMRLTDTHASANRADPNANVISKGRNSESTGDTRCK